VGPLKDTVRLRRGQRGTLRRTPMRKLKKGEVVKSRGGRVAVPSRGRTDVYPGG